METALRSAMISAARRSVGTVSARHALFTSRGSTSPCRSLQQARDFHQRLPRTYIAATSRRYVSLMPESQDPPAPNPESQVNSSVEKGPTDPTPLTDQEYHEHADRYLNSVIQEVEGLQEDRQDVDFEHAAGVLTITFPPNGTYVINKQPPNKQIWLSSPITGPKRFNWLVKGESMSEKQEAGVGDWVYLRDGTSMTQLLATELGITVDQGDMS